METLRAHLAQKNLTIENYYQFTGKSEKKLRMDLRPDAEQNIRSKAALQRIAELEKLEATEDDVREMCEEICRLNHIGAEDLQKIYDEKLAETVRSTAVARKAIRVLRENAVVSEHWTEI